MIGMRSIKLSKKIAVFILSVFFILSFSTPVFAANNSNHPLKKDHSLINRHINAAPSWHFLIAPYGWIFGMRGDMIIRGTRSTVDMTPHDILNLLDDVDFIGELHMEAEHGPLTLMVDPTYLKLTTDVGVGPIGVTLSPSLTILDFGAFYTVLTNPALHDATSPVKFQLFAGGRYFKMKLKISPKRFPSASGSQHILAPIVGGRLIFPIDKKFTFTARGDIGGFDFDDTQSTWSATLLGQYAFNKCVTLAVGYRFLGIHFIKNVAGTTTKSGMNITFYGPVVGIIFKI